MMIVRSESERDASIDRRLGWLFALGGCIVILTQTLLKLHEMPLWAWWWNAAAWTIFVGIVLLAVTGLTLPSRLLRTIWWIIPILYMALQGLWVAGFRGPDTSAATLWIWTFEPPVLTMLVLLLRPGAAIGVSLLIPLIPALASLALLQEVPAALGRAVPIQLGNVIYVVVFIVVHNQLRRLRAHELEARAQEKKQVRLAALAAEHTRVSQIVHDEVLSTLAAAIQTDGNPPMVLKRAAAATLQAIDLSIDAPEPLQARPLPTGQCAEEIVSSLRKIDDEFELESVVAPGTLPSGVTRAVTLAAAEALRNSMRHAGSDADRRVYLHLGDGELRVTVLDDGVGFDPGSVRSGIGIPESIERRMRDAGGAASIVSRPGAGAEVTLTWTT